jgi:hypothetical protein
VRQVENGDAIFLLPEGILRLKGTAGEIIGPCDGEHTFADVPQAIGTHCPSPDPKHVEQETESFLNRLLERRMVDLQ